MAVYQEELKKLLGRWDSVAIMIGIVIGVGIFRVPAEVAGYLKSPVFIILAWMLGGVISLLGALCYAELSSSFPRTGGDYIFLKESYGPLTAFLFGWTELLVVRSGSIAAVTFIFAEYAQSFLSLGEKMIKPAAVITVFSLAVVNIAGMRHGKRAQNIFTLTKVIALIVIIVFGLLSGKGDITNFHATENIPVGKIFSLLGVALIPILWTYAGWHENTFVAGETKDAGKNLPFALITGVTIIVALYLAINSLYMYLMPVGAIAGSKLIASDALQIMCGKFGRKVLEALVIVSSLGCINAMIITGSRIVYAMGKDNAVFKYMGKADAVRSTPYRAILVIAVWSSVLILLGTFKILLFFTGILVWLFSAMVTGGLIILRRKFPKLERPYKVAYYPATPVIFMLISIFLFANTLIYYPLPSVAGLCLLLTGIPVYILSQKRR